MAVVVDMRFPGSKIAVYDAVMAETDLVGASADQVPGLIAHYAFEQDGSLRVIDIWETAEQWQAFSAGTIVPAATRAGLTIDPAVTISELHATIR